MPCQVVSRFGFNGMYLYFTHSASRYLYNRQPGRALPYLLRLHDPTAFDLIRENNLFTAVQDQALLLVEFDQELMRKAEGQVVTGPSPAIPKYFQD